MIHIEDNYYVYVDDYSYALKQDTGRIDKKKGGKVFNNLGYYSSIEKALQAYNNERIKQNLVGNLELCDAIRIIKKTCAHTETVIEDALRRADDERID